MTKLGPDEKNRIQKQVGEWLDVTGFYWFTLDEQGHMQRRGFSTLDDCKIKLVLERKEEIAI